MSPLWFDLAILLGLIALNGFFAMSEMAIVSSRKPRLRALAANGYRGAATANALATEPGPFLSTVQIGITLIGILAGAYSGARFGGPVSELLERAGLSQIAANQLGFGLVIALTTYVSLIIGELLPKRFALNSPERVACIVAPFMAGMARLAAPLVWLLDRSSSFAFRLAGIKNDSESPFTAEELRLVVAEAQHAGVIEASEHHMISGVMRLAERPVRGVMTPRTDVDWLDADSDAETIRAALIVTPHTRLPVAAGSVDEILGVVQAKDLLAGVLRGDSLDLRALARPAPVVPDMMDATDALVILQNAEVPMALVHDEYGHFEGVVTPADLLAAIAGVFRSDIDAGTDPPAVEREDGSWLFSGSLPADEMADRLGLSLPASRDYQTVAGFMLAGLRHLPETGEVLEMDDWHFEVVDMDGRKIDKVLAIPVPVAEPSETDEV